MSSPNTHQAIAQQYFLPSMISKMEKLLLVYVFVVFASSLTCCRATTYMVGDNSGWDISTNLDSWANGKTFTVGDVLVFQYSSSHSVSEVTRENFESCNTTNVVRTYSAGNTTVTLEKPGDRYFVCGNKLHCLAGMKLKVTAEANQSAAPAGAPQAATTDSDQGSNNNNSGVIRNPSSKSNKQIPSSTASFSRDGRVVYAIGLAFLGFVLNFHTILINV